MKTNIHDSRPRWGDFKALQARFPGVFARTRAYELLAQGKLRAKRLGGRRIWDFESAEELISNLPEHELEA